MRGPKQDRERHAKKTGFQRIFSGQARKRRMMGHETVRSWLIRNLHLQLMCRSRSGDARRLLPAGWKGETGFDRAGRAKIFRSKKKQKKT
ncbi:MAG: hypothetical protein CW346_05260 [Bacillaceae bacterium]|nr:hypothetical protein [Bacillaceae bacterium]